VKDLIAAAEVMIDIAKTCGIDNTPAQEKLKEALTNAKGFQENVNRLRKDIERGKYG
jgi:predicted DsbA family dithiol-disulfide isomerase